MQFLFKDLIIIHNLYLIPFQSYSVSSLIKQHQIYNRAFPQSNQLYLNFEILYSFASSIKLVYYPMSHNSNFRLEIFSDGVFAIAITLLILDMKVPPLESVHSSADLWQNVIKLWPSFFALIMSFIIILIAWIGHHNLLRGLDKTSAKFQFANGFFLFTVIFFPFPTAFMAEYLNSPYAQPAIEFYCLNAILHNIGWNLLYRYILYPKPLVKESIDVEHIKESSKGAKYGFVLYSLLAVLAIWLPYVALVISFMTWIYWLYISVNIKTEEN
jgi:uncharacterized membrane protein